MVQLKFENISSKLTKEIVQKAFQSKTNSNDIIKSIDICPAAPAGEGLIGAVYRIKVIGNNHTASFIGKGYVTDPLLRRSINPTKFFKREILFFTRILPALIELQKSSGAKENIQNVVPKCYEAFCNGQDDFLLLEDLMERTCKSFSSNPTREERDKMLDVLAHFHATSMALRIKTPSIFEGFAKSCDEVYFNVENRDWYARYLHNAVEIDKAVVSEYEDPSSEYHKRFMSLVNDDVYGQLIKNTSAWGSSPVLCHGDTWLANFLHCDDKAVLIDFQILRCASPATDLAYFILLCSNLCSIKEEFTEAVNIYYKALEHYLSDMGVVASKVFSLESLNEELEKFGKFGFLAALTSIPLLASEKCDTHGSFDSMGVEKLPLEVIWRLTPIVSEFSKMQLINALHVSVDVGLF